MTFKLNTHLKKTPEKFPFKKNHFWGHFIYFFNWYMKIVQSADVRK